MASNVIQHRPRRSGVSLTTAPHLASLEAANSPDAELLPADTATAANPIIAVLHSPTLPADSSPLVTLRYPQEGHLPNEGALQDRRHSGGGAALLGRRPSAGGGALLDRRQSGSGSAQLAGAHSGNHGLLAPLEPPALRHGRKTSAMSNAHGRPSSHVLQAAPEIHQVCCYVQDFQLSCCLKILVHEYLNRMDCYYIFYVFEYVYCNLCIILVLSDNMQLTCTIR